MVIFCADVLTVKQAVTERLIDLKAKQSNAVATATMATETTVDCIVSHKEFEQYEPI